MSEFPDRPPERSTGRLLTDAAQQLGDLVRGEVALARAEVEDGLRRAVGGIVLMIVAVVLANAALFILCGALVAWLVAEGVPPGWAALAVAAGLAVIVLILLLVGRRLLDPARLFPRRTAKNIRRDAEQIKEIVTNDPSP